MILNEYRPDYVSSPSETLREVLEERGLLIDVDDDLIITPEIATSLQRTYGINAEFWLAREQQYRNFMEQLWNT